MDETYDINSTEMPTEQEIADLKKALARRRVPQPDIDEAWDDCLRRMGQRARRRSKLRYVAFAAAAAAAAVLLLVVLLRGRVEEEGPKASDDGMFFAAVESSADVTVTSSDGDKAVDGRGPLSFRQQQKLSKVETVTVATPRGKAQTLVLPDGTKVWLNAETKLTFPSQFVSGRREVKLSGEAFFEVKPDKARPFIVSTGQLDAKVLGTSFNVRAYAGSLPCVVLVEGSVSVSSPASGDVEKMKPGELARLSASGGISLASVDVYPHVQWREGFFYFNNVEAREILKEIGRWYNVSIVVESPEKLSRRIHFVAERDSSLHSTLSHLNGLGDLEVELLHNKIVVK